MPNKNPKFSAIVVSYNCQDVIYQCIESLLLQPNCEVILIDNNSQDHTVKQIETFIDRIVFIQNSINNGFTKACNQGIDIAKGEYLLLFNPDAYASERSLEKLTDKLDEDASLGAVSPQLFFPNGTIQNYNRRFPFISGVLVESFVPSRFWNVFKSYRKYVYCDLDLSKENFLEQPAGAAFLFRKGFRLDENYFIYGSDVELCKNIIDKGFKIKTVPSSHVYHHQSKGGTENTNFMVKMYLQLEFYYAMRYFFKKHRGFLYASLYTFLNLVFLFIIAFITTFTFNEYKIKIKFLRFWGFLLNKKMKTGGGLT